MKSITIKLAEGLFEELEVAARGEFRDSELSPATWAQECVESALAMRRLPQHPHLDSLVRSREVRHRVARPEVGG